MKNVRATDKSIQNRIEGSLCLTSSLPKDLSEKQYLGDSKYLKKWGFHLLDSFRIDDTLTNGSVHQMDFKLSEYNLLRLIVFHDRVDTDLELYKDNIIIAKSNSKNFEDVIVIELPPGNYKIILKFYPPIGGYKKCESIRMEFPINAFHLIQDNIDRMMTRHKNKPTLDTYRHDGSFKREKLVKTNQEGYIYMNNSF
jgi:hypothetical protein